MLLNILRRFCVLVLLVPAIMLPAAAQRRRACCSTASSGANGIQYHGGPVMAGTVNVYYIWYGTWNGSGANGTNPVSDSPATRSLMDILVRGLSGSAYEQTNATYNGGGNYVSGLLDMAGAVNDAYSRGMGKTLTEHDVYNIVASHAGNDLPLDTNGIYMVLTSSDVAARVSDGTNTYTYCATGLYGMCGWHGSASYFNIAGSDLKFGFVGNPDRCPAVCLPNENRIVSPNNNTGADGMANHIAHELSETLNDPDGNAWFDDLDGLESADKCSFRFGTETTLPNGSRANINLLNANFLIQQNWVNALGGFCAMAW